MQTHLKTNSKKARGFSLVELLIVVSVIGIIAAIAIPSIGSVTAASKTATYQRNAQNVVSTFQSGQAAGVAWDTSGTKTAIVNLVIAGATASGGPYNGKQFKVPNLAGSDLTNALPYIGKDAVDGSLYYNSAGGIAGP